MDYSNMQYPPFDKSTIGRLDVFPEFRNFEIADRDKFIFYLILVYDRDSDLFSFHGADSLYIRKREAAIKVGFKQDKDGHFDKYVEEVLCGENEAFNMCQFRYIRLSGIPDLPVLIKYIEMLDKEMSTPLPDKPKDRQYIQDNIETLLTKIEGLEVKIFTGKESEKARESLYKLLEQERVRLRPEYVAEAIQAGKLSDVIGM